MQRVRPLQGHRRLDSWYQYCCLADFDCNDGNTHDHQLEDDCDDHNGSIDVE